MWVRSSIAFYGNFNLDMDRSPGFGSTLTDFIALLRLGFPSAPRLYRLTSPASVTRRTVLQKVRGCTHKVLPQLVNTGFQVLFHSPPGVLFTFPSQYYALSVTKEYLALGGWSPRLPTRFHVSRGTLDPAVLVRILCTGLSPSLAGFPKTIPLSFPVTSAVHNPSMHARWFRLLPFRSPLLWESSFLSFPPAT